MDTENLNANDPIETLLLREERKVGPFHLRHRLGSGGFAPVYLANEMYGDEVLRTVAVKLFIAPKVADGLGGGVDPRVRDAIVNEARALCRVEHPNVVRFHQIAEAGDGQLLALVMELVRGTSVAAMLETQRRLPIPVALDIAIAVASALAAVHRSNLVHRDVKPENIVESQGIYKLIDFGIAAGESRQPTGVSPTSVRVQKGTLPSALANTLGSAILAAATGRTEHASASNNPNILAGTIGYIDPVSFREQVPATPASDLYALGCVLYECLTGRLPSSPANGSVDHLRMEVLAGQIPPPPIQSIVGGPEIPRDLAELVDALVASTREPRPKSAEWVVAELERIRRGIDGTSAALPSEDEGPFRGLDAFEPRHRAVFLGRSTEIASALETLRSHGLLVVVGASGSGKSSLARAAVLPAIEEGKLGAWPPKWDSVVATPGADARLAILAALGPHFGTSDEHDPRAVASALVARAERSGRGLVLLLDQMEELVTQGSLEGRRFAIELLALLAERPLPGVRAVVALRRDFLDPLLAEVELGRALGRNMLLVAPLTVPVWRDIVSTGIGRYGYTMDPTTMNEIVGQLKEMESAMPLVQFALARVWERRDRATRTIPHAALMAIGGITGALEIHAEELVTRLVATHGPNALLALERVTMVLTTPQGTRLQVDESVLVAKAASPLAKPVVTALEAARLVVREGTSLAFTHDAVIGGWRRLAEWIRTARADRETVADLEVQAARWSAKRQRELLWQKSRLGDARRILDRGVVDVSHPAYEFVRAGRLLEIRRLVASGMLVTLALAGLALAVGLFQTSRQGARDNRAEFMRVQDDIQNHRVKAIEKLQEKLVSASDERDTCKTSLADEQRQMEDTRKKADADRVEASRVQADLQSQRDRARASLQRCEQGARQAER